MDRLLLERHILETYPACTDYPFQDDAVTQVFRHEATRKWFALVMEIDLSRLEKGASGSVAVVNLKCDPLLIPSLCQLEGIYPAYHMAKRTWISVLLDGTVSEDRVKDLVDMSFTLTWARPKKKQQPKETETC